MLTNNDLHVSYPHKPLEGMSEYQIEQIVEELAEKHQGVLWAAGFGKETRELILNFPLEDSLERAAEGIEVYLATLFTADSFDVSA